MTTNLCVDAPEPFFREISVPIPVFKALILRFEFEFQFLNFIGFHGVPAFGFSAMYIIHNKSAFPASYLDELFISYTYHLKVGF